MSGHSKWSTIKHKKGAQDAKRGKVFTKLIKEITIAARSGADPAGNPRLRRAMDTARAANMPTDNIARAIKKGTGELEGVHYEELLYEAVGPGGILLLMQVTTENRNRTASEVRKILDKHGGQLGSSGSAAWGFDEKGIIQLAKDSATEEALLEAAVSAGAEDVSGIGDRWVVTTPREELEAVREGLQKAGLRIEEAALAFVPKNLKIVEGRQAEVLISLVEALDEHDDVQRVSADFELSEEALAALG